MTEQEREERFSRANDVRERLLDAFGQTEVAIYLKLSQGCYQTIVRVCVDRDGDVILEAE